METTTPTAGKTRMNYTGEACANCRKRCLLLHGTTANDSTNTSYSFFKIMFGDRFSNALFFPPTVAPFVSPFVNKEVKLEDRSRKQWKARVSYTQDSYALQEGWNFFVSEHGVEQGDFLVFHYVGEAHFLVEFYCWRTACQKLKFSAYSEQSRSQNGITVAAKKAKALAGKIGSSTSTGAGRGNVNGYGTSGGAEGISLPPGRVIGKSLDALELPSSTIDSQYKGKQAIKSESATANEKIGTRESLGDTKMKTFNRKGKGNAGLALVAHSEAVSDGKGLIQKKPACAINLDTPKLKTIEEDFKHGERCRRLDASKNTAFPRPVTSSKPKAATDSETSSCRPNVVLQGCSLSNALIRKQSGKEPVVIDLEQMKVFDLPVGDCSNAPRAKKLEAANMVDLEQIQVSDLPIGDRSNAPGAKKREDTEMVIDLEQEQLQLSNFPIRDRSNAPGGKKREATEMVPRGTREESPIVLSRIADSAGMKHELVRVEYSPAPAKARFTCSITDQQPFLELPELLSGMIKKRRGRPWTRNILFVLLRDPEMRLWPVFYLEDMKYNVKLFASGWEAFSQANGIQTGDECVFGVEGEVDGTAILQVGIVRKLRLCN